ncbi:MAG: acyl-CoA thioesterase [Cytophagaceae bacterium]|jgi:acyl-CoA thioester hydrolase|nr:acyl-CoA thioesterase [Cytophagaceae bacterium]
MIEKSIQIRVRYAETDQMGYVYYGNYATYFEVARVETFREIGFSYKEMEAAGIMMPVLEYKTKFIKPAKYDDALTIKVMVKNQPSVRILFEYEVHNEHGELLTVAETTLVFINAKTGRPMVPEAYFKSRMDRFFEIDKNN